MSRLDIGDTINAAAAWAGRSPTVQKVIGNPFTAALVLTALVGIILMAVFHYKVAGDVRRIARAGFYIYIASTLLMFLHYSLISQNVRAASAIGGAHDVVSDVMNQARGGGSGSEYVPVLPSLSGNASSSASSSASSNASSNASSVTGGSISNASSSVSSASSVTGGSSSSASSVSDLDIASLIHPVRENWSRA